MKEITVNIPSTTFPSQFASDSEKATMAYGLLVGESIQYEWFKRDSSSTGRYYDQWRTFHRRRRYARAEQPVQKYKDEISIDGDMSHLNLDWTPIPILPKFVDIVVNGMQNRMFKPKAYAQDAMSAQRRRKHQDMVEAQMVNKDFLKGVQQNFGVNPFTMSPDDLPGSDEELSLYMQLNYKPAIEIAEEEAISTILSENSYEDIKRRMDYDLVVLGIAVAKHQFNPGEGVVIDYVDPANVVYSYTEDPHFKDCFYWGEIKTVPISELIKIDPTLTNDDLETINKQSQSWYDYFNVSQFHDNQMFLKDTATLMYYNYKTTKKFVYKKKIQDSGMAKMVEKEDTFNPPQEMLDEGRFEKVEKTIDVWYSGVMVMGTNIILKWELQENMVRPKSASQHAMSEFVACAPRMYKGSIESLLTRMIPFADLIQINHLKLQQVASKIVPDGIFIDADGLNEVNLGEGGSYTPEDALRLYFQTGSVVGRSYTGDGEFNHARVPIQELSTNSGQNKMMAIINNINHYLDMIRGVTGLNEARDGSMPDPRSLVGVQKLAALNSNTATKHILDASLYVLKRMSECISCRVSDIMEYSDFAEEFANQIGKYNVGILDEIKDLYMYDFGVFIEVSPDEEQKAKLEENIQQALSKENINLEDAIDIREVNNIKLANQLLKVKRLKKQDRDLEERMMMQQQQSEAQMQQQQMAAQAQMQKIQAEGQVKLQLIQAETEKEIRKLQTEAQLKAQLMAEEFQYQMQVKGAEVQSLKDRESYKEDRKDKRVDKQSSQQSKMIQQRQAGGAPVNFESNEDSLDGLGFEEFEPR